MTKREWEQRQHQERALATLGITPEDAARLRRISSSLRNSFEFSCCYDESQAAQEKRSRREENLEAKARQIVAEAWAEANPQPECRQTEILRAASMLPKAPAVYVQTDPRGCALYVVPAETIARFPGQPLDSIYSQGIAVYS